MSERGVVRHARALTTLPRYVATYDAVVIGASAGGLAALSMVFGALPKEFPAALLIVQHMAPDSDTFLATHLNKLCAFIVEEGSDKAAVMAAHAYVAPAGYHMLVERDRVLALTVDPKVNYARPSIDVLFESAAEVYGSKLVGVILTGANQDGVHGAQCIERAGGCVVVQDPQSAEAPFLPQAAIKGTGKPRILTLSEIGPYLASTVVRAGRVE